MQTEGPSKPFTQMLNRLKPGLLESDQHVRGREKGGKTVYYTHDPLMPTSPFDGDASEERRKKYTKGAEIVRDALTREYGEKAADFVLRKVTEATGRKLEKEVTRGDLVLIHQEVQQYKVQQHAGLQVQDQEQQELQKQRPELQVLQDRISYDAPNVIKDDLAAGWKSTIEKYYGPNGAGKVELLQDYMQRYTVEFKDDEGTLTLTLKKRRGFVDLRNEVDKAAALAGFIERHFSVKPPNPVFRNIANNILLYLPLGASLSMERKMQHVVNDGLSSYTTDAVAQSSFTLSGSKDSDGKPCGIGVACDASLPYTKNAYGPVDFSKYKFVRKEAFEISLAQLTSDPPAFDPRANLVAVSRLDTIQLAGERAAF